MENTHLFSIPSADLAKIHSRAHTFVRGPFGAGKTSLAIERVRWLLRQERVRGDDILVLVPQPINARAFTQALSGSEAPPGPPVEVNTFATIARNAVELYWPLIAPRAGFDDPNREPTFLNVEMAQYHLGRLVDESVARQEFSGIVIRRNRIVVQMLNNFSRAALYNFSIDEVYDRLIAALGERTDAGQINALQSARRISHAFRDFCRRESLLDFSLQVEVFQRHVLTHDWSRTHLLRSRRHLIADNMEEESPAGHRLIGEWAAQLDSLLICVDDDGGYRTTLGADPEGANELASLCREQIVLTASQQISPGMERVVNAFNAALPLPGASLLGDNQRNGANRASLRDVGEHGLSLTVGENQETFRFYPQMIRGVAREVAALVHERAVAPGEIAIVAPTISDSLRFSLQTELARYDIPSTGHRPSRALEDEPATRTLLTLAKLAHPQWNLRPATQDVAQALAYSVASLDPVRAALLTNLVYPLASTTIDLRRFGDLPPDARRRITYAAGEAYDALRDWLYAYRSAASPGTQGDPSIDSNVPFSDPNERTLDQFMARLFEQVLSQPGYGFRDSYDAVRVAHQLVNSARRLRWALQPPEKRTGQSIASDSVLEIGREYVAMIDRGILGALYVPAWRAPDDAVLISPVPSFLLRNITVRHQFWLDVGSLDWWERLYTPLTHPYVLSHRWQRDRVWQDENESFVRVVALRRQTLGLLRRASEQIHLAMSDYSESGYEQRGPLLRVANRILA